jgi:hypothetical protein
MHSIHAVGPGAFWYSIYFEFYPDGSWLRPGLQISKARAIESQAKATAFRPSWAGTSQSHFKVAKYGRNVIALDYQDSLKTSLTFLTNKKLM